MPETIRMNQRMRIIAGATGEKVSQSLEQALLEILKQGFVEQDGCIVFAWFKEAAGNTSVAQCFDETGYECFLNHLHIQDYLKNSSYISARLEQGFAFILCLASLLMNRYPSATFKIILSCSDDDCSVRFHKVRPNQTWVRDDLETYESEALAVLTV